MTARFTNFASSKLAGGISDAATALTVTATEGALYPSVSAGQFFDLVIEDRTVFPVLREVVRCTGRSSDVLTISRHQEGTTARAWAAGVTVSHRVTAASMASLRDDAVASINYLGSFASPPSLKNDGSVLNTSCLYYDSNFHDLFTWNGIAWLSASQGTTTRNFGGDVNVEVDLTVGGDVRIDGSSTILGGLDVIEDLIVHGSETVVGSVSIGGGQTVGGASSLHGAVKMDGPVTIGGAATIVGNTSFSGSATVAGTIRAAAFMIGDQLIAAYDDVSGDFSHQLFPDGTMMQWGSDATSSGKFFPNAQVRVTYPVPYDNRTVNVDVVPIGGTYGAGSAFSSFLIVGEIDRFGFTVVSFNKVSEPEGPCGFYWKSLGV